MDRTRHLLVVGVAVVLLAAACGKTTPVTSSTSSGNVTQTTEQLGEPVMGGSLTFSVEAETSDGWCLPQSQLAGSGIMVANTMFDSLFQYDEKFVPQPYLAKSYEWKNGYQDLNIELRPNIKFSDDTPLTADVVKFNLDVSRGDHDAVARTKVKPLLFVFVYKDIANITVTGPLSLTIHTARPWPHLVDQLAAGRNGIISEKQLLDPDCASHPAGTGPFKMVKWDHDKSLELVRNPNYWRKDAKGRQLPYLDKLTFVPIQSNPDRYDRMLGGSVQAAHFNNQVQFDAISKNSKLQIVHEVTGHKEVAYAMFNTKLAPLDDVEVRRHVMMAIDPQRINAINSGNVWKDANGPFDTGVIGHLDDSGAPQYDQAAAKQFFQGHKGVKVRIKFSSDPTVKDYVEEMKSELTEVGVEAVVDETDQSSLIEQALGGDFDILMWRNHPGADPDTQYIWWHSGSPVNFNKISDPTIDKLLDEGRTSTDETRRKQIYEDLNRALNKGAYDMWEWYTEWAVASDKHVKNLTGATFPDNTKKLAGLHWGWMLLDETWVEK